MRRLLVANRGEIAVRVIRACREMGIAPVAVYSECDRAARHVRMADQAVAIGGNAAGESYLRIDRLLDAALATGADAIHPGYGFLSENEDFAAACRDAGLIFIGPSPEAIALMGSKTAARDLAIRAGAPVVPGSDPIAAEVADEAIAEQAKAIGYPLMVKAVAGGGGKGMRAITDAAQLPGAIRAARSEALAAFGDATIYLERRLIAPRHIEVQLLADHHGTVLPFVERDCSLQRRHQKVIEESPSPAIDARLREQLTSAAAAVARAAGYTNAGTIEFLFDGGRFYFLEMNTRLQVEHPVTEMVTGVDLVQWQIRIARGERLTVDPAQALTPRGHAIECRVYAEDADAGFLPSPGRITGLRVPAGPGIRDDSGVEAGGEVPIFYDPMISKLIAWADDRPAATARMQRALDEYEVRGIRTSLPFFRWMLRQPAFADASFHTGWLDELLQQRAGEPFSDADPSLEEVAALVAAMAQNESPSVPVEIEVGRDPRSGPASGRRFHLERDGDGWRIDGRTVALEPVHAGAVLENGIVYVAGRAIPVRVIDPRAWIRSSRRGRGTGADHRQVTAPMPGRVVKVLVKPGDAVKARQGLIVVEAMKMENELRAPGDAVVRDVPVREGASVEAGTILVVLD